MHIANIRSSVCRKNKYATSKPIICAAGQAIEASKRVEDDTYKLEQYVNNLSMLASHFISIILKSQYKT